MKKIILGILIVCSIIVTVLGIRRGILGMHLRDEAETTTLAETTEEYDPSIIKADVEHRKAVPAETLHIHNAEFIAPNHHDYIESEREKQIYSYVQAPPEYYVGDFKWVGDWCHIMAGGQEFIYFGCGICCLSNICSTFRQEPITPDVVYYEAKDLVSYRPESGVGAMSWSQLKKMCEHYGLKTELKNKPKEYSQFQKDMLEAEAAIILVCKANDDKLWYYTNGHYVNVWEYDPETDTVFLSDASNLYNRARVALVDVYNALKTSSNAQYLVASP